MRPRPASQERTMSNGIFTTPIPRNEPVLAYAPGSAERKTLGVELRRMAAESIEIAPTIGGKKVKTGKTAKAVVPHDHARVLATWHKAGGKEVEAAIEASQAAYPEWSRMPWQQRAAIFLRAGELLAGPRR